MRMRLAVEPELVEPGQPAPAAGIYDEHNKLGMRTGMSVLADQGHLLPRLPRGFFWRLARLGAEPVSAEIADPRRL